MDPSPFSSPLSSPPGTPQPSPPLSSLVQPRSSEQQCTCPCGPFQAELKVAVTLMTFVRHPIPRLVTFPYPTDTAMGQCIPVEGLSEYSKSHIWPDGIHCFCSLRSGVVARSVRLIIPSHGPMQSKPCLGCSDDGVDGCRYFVNLADLFQKSEPLFKTGTIPLRSFPRHVHVKKLLVASCAQIPAPEVSLPLVRPHCPTKPSVSRMQEYFPYTFHLDGVKPGTISDPKRIWSPPPPGEAFRRVEAMALPATAEVKEVFDEMVNGAGVPYRRLMAVIGGCQVCDQVMTLPNILTHACLGRAKEKGPSPPEHPLLLEHKRTLPTAASRIMGSSSGILADDGTAFADVPIDAPTRKRKRTHSFSSRGVLVPR